MPIKFRCKNCGRLLSAKDEDSGKRAKCPGCRQPTVVPVISEEVEPPPAVAPQAPVPLCEITCRCGRILKLTPAQLKHGVVCVNCGRRIPEGEEPQAPPRHEMTELPWGLGPTLRDAFVYPARGTGLLSVAIVTVVMFLSQLIAGICCLFIVLLVLALGYAASYLLSAIAGSARMERNPPDLPDYRDISGDLLLPFALFAAPALLCYLPAIAYSIMTAFGILPWLEITIGGYFAPVGLLSLLVLGSFVFPMALMRVAGLYSLRGLNPGPIFRTVSRVPLQYLGLVLLLLLAITVSFVTRAALGMTSRVGICVGALAGPFISFYITVVEMRLMGMFVAKYQERLGWTDMEM